MSTLRVVLDTNVLLSGIAYPASVPGKIMAAWRYGSLDILLSAYLLDELRRVLPRAQRHGLNSAEIDNLVDILSLQAEIIEPSPSIEADLRDTDDPPVLGILRAALDSSGADYLITGDQDLLALAERYPIVAPATFWATHGGV
jgi:putative PIN family toxin of toxin-antitoxin system